MVLELLFYRNQIEDLPLCIDPLFRENLTQYRAGNLLAAQWISGSCLRIAYELAMKMEDPPAALCEIERIEEANAGLWLSINSFTGSSAEEFIEHARKHISARLESWRGKAA